MPKRTLQEKSLRKELLQEKKEARRLAKLEKERKKSVESEGGRVASNKKNNGDSSNNEKDNDTVARSFLLSLPEDAVHQILCFLPSADLGRISLTCRQLNLMLPSVRVPYTLSRLHRPLCPLPGAVGFIDLCCDEEETRILIEQSYLNSGCVVAKGKNNGSNNKSSNEFVSYARFIEEAVSGYAVLGFNPKSPEFLPSFVKGRFASVSPEHSLCRVGGDGQKCGAGGSGVASWGVGKRGQLGHGKRQDERLPKIHMGGLGYGIRIVQVSAGGGLVRVAHSLLLTATGRVLSFGTGQYGALGHGYSSGKQLPDVLRPQYVEALASVRCVCVSAGELHSAVVTTDGDVYTWGDGFCGQLGHGDKRPQLLPKQVSKGGLEDECIASVSCGSRHTLTVSEDGEVFSWGLGHFGVLGRSFTPFDYDADAGVVAPGRDDALPVALAGIGLDVNVNATDTQNQQGEGNVAADLMAHLHLISNLSLDDSSNQCLPMAIDSLKGVKIVGASAGHRHSLLLDKNGGLYSFGAGGTGCLGHNDTSTHMYPLRVIEFVEKNVRVMQMSAGVDISMAVSTTGDVYAWGKTDQGRIGLGLSRGYVSVPQRVSIQGSDGEKLKAVDIECGYVHSIIVALNGTIHMCGNVGTDGENDGLTEEGATESLLGHPRQMPNFNIWHRLPEPKEHIKTERWKKYGKYEVKGRSQMMALP